MTTKSIDLADIAQQASEERAKTEAVFTSIGDGAIATDEFGKITRVNPAALRILGYKEREVLGDGGWDKGGGPARQGFDERVPDILAAWQERWPHLPALWSLAWV